MDEPGDSRSVRAAALVEELAAQRRVVAAAQARQAALMVEFAAVRRGLDASRIAEGVALGGRERYRPGEFSASEIGMAVVESRHRVQRTVGVALRLQGQAPNVWDAWLAGDVDLLKATRINQALLRLTRDGSRVLLDALVVPVAACKTVELLGRWLNQFIARVEPAETDERLRRSLDDRYVSVRPDLDGISFLSAAMSSVDAAAVDQVLNGLAAAAGPDDGRTVQQRRADALVDLLLGRTSNGCHVAWHDGDEDDCREHDHDGHDDAGHEGVADEAPVPPAGGGSPGEDEFVGAGGEPGGSQPSGSDAADENTPDTDVDQQVAPWNPDQDWDLPASAFRPDPDRNSDQSCDGDGDGDTNSVAGTAAPPSTGPTPSTGAPPGRRQPPDPDRTGHPVITPCPTGHPDRPLPVSIGVIVSIQSLLGYSDAPGQLADRSALVPADLARALAAQPGTLFHRLLTDTEGNLLQVNELGRFPSRKLGAAIKWRDGSCTNPICTVSGHRCDLDHIVPVPHGPTTAANLDGKCRGDHRAKTHGGHRTTRDDRHRTTTWTTPTGHSYTTHDDPLPVQNWPGEKPPPDDA